MSKNPLQPEPPFIPFAVSDIEQSIPARFEEQVRRYPDNLAIYTPEETLTYEALNRKANQVAMSILKHLKRHRGIPCVMLLDQGVSLIVSIMGILKSGNIYVPLDPQHNEKANAKVAAELGAQLIVTDNNNLAAAMKLKSRTVTIININTLDPGVSDVNPNLNLSPKTPAYLFYTSGTTGQSKGVMDCHRNVLHNILRYTNSLFIHREDKLTLLQSCSFSGSVSSLFCALLNGACVFVLSIRKEGLNTLVDIMQKENITLYHSVPSLFRHVALFGSRFPSLRVIRLEGDQVKPLDIELYKKHFANNCVLVNGLGATECGLVRQYFVQKQTILESTTVPLGYEVEDMEILILGESGNLLKDNQVGEIAVKSRYLATGYWQKPDLTAKVFSRIDKDGFRIYRTGDLGCLSSDGCLELIGRKDSRVKIRGMPVELVEIEETLNRHPDVQESVVLSFLRSDGEMWLAAYFVASPTSFPDLRKLRQFLLQELPDYKVPAYFIAIDKIPLTANGKIDRKALPAPDQTRPEFEQFDVPPRSPIEEMLVSIWREVLTIDRIGIHDNFFELGGHSLLAIVLCTKIEAKIGKPIPVELIFKFPTLARLSGALEKHVNIESKNPNSIITAFQTEGTQPPFFWLHGGKVVPLILELLGANQPLYFLNHQSMNGKRAKHLTVPEMASYYLQNILQINSEGPYYLGGYSIGGMIIYEVARQLCEQGKKVALLFLLDPTSISNDKDIQNFPRLYREHYKLKNTGYVTYFKTFPIRLKNKFQKELDKIIIPIYFSLGKSIPARLYWIYIDGIYIQAKLSYQPEQPLEDIEKAVIIHINNRASEDWINLFTGKIETCAIDCGHEQLLETPYTLIWLKILKQTIKESLSK